MGIFLRGVNRRRKSKGSSRSKKVKEFFQMLGVLLIFIFMATIGSVEYDPTGYIKGKKIFAEPVEKAVQGVSGKKEVKKIVEKPVKKTKKKTFDFHGHKVKSNLSGVEQWRSLVEKYFPAYAVNSALCIMNEESRGDHTVHNYNPYTRDDSWGLYQVNLWGDNKKTRPSPSELKKPEINIAWAYGCWKRTGKRFGSTACWHNSAIKCGIH